MISSLDKLHYSFCGDLGDKEVYYLDTSFQPKWQLYTINHPNFVEKLTDTTASWITGTTNLADFYDSENIKLPSNLYKIEKYDNFWTGLNKNDIMLLLMPDDFYTGRTFVGIGTETSDCFYERNGSYYFELASQDYTTDPPTQINPQIIQEISKNLVKYNHLINHSTFQFCFSNEPLFPANLRYLNFCLENDKWLVKYLLKVKATPAGILYTFLSGRILWQLKIEIKQSVPSNKTLKKLLTAAMVVVTITGAFMLAGAIGAGGAGLADGSSLNAVQGDLSKLNQTNQLLSGAKSLLPDENGSISYSFSLFDFWSRLRKRPFWGKIHVSNTLKNNLKHNNNQNPITYPLNITFPKLGMILKKGYWQGKLKLAYDPGNWLQNKFNQGITFFEDMSKDFPKPDLGVVGTTNLIIYNLGDAGRYVGEEIREGGEPTTVPSNRPKGSNYHQRGHYFIFYEDGSKEHWMALYPMFQDSELAKGHNHGSFILEFDRPVKQMVDIYSCIGCGAQNTPLFDALHSNYRSGSSDSWDTIHRGLPFEPWFTEMGRATASEYNLTVNGTAGRLGSQGDVWEKATQQRSDGKSFVKAYGYVPSGDTITWDLTDEGTSRVVIQKVPQHDDFSGLDWSPPPGSGGDIEIPLEDPEIALPEPGEGDIRPEDDFTPDTLDISGGEVEIPAIEIDLPPDITQDLDNDQSQDPDPPPIDIDHSQDQDNSQDQDQSQDTSDQDRGDPEPPPPDIPDDDPDGD